MKTHSTIGETILKELKFPVTEIAIIIAISHHENWERWVTTKALKEE
jgi:response regulator RpfG family c-di-GMP phosphodiesterase